MLSLLEKAMINLKIEKVKNKFLEVEEKNLEEIITTIVSDMMKK